MSYIALYRTYRPKKFSEVYGQTVIVKTLQNALKHQKLSHAYLFSGPRGTGKTSIAKIVAKAINCQNAPTDEPCGVCPICQGIDKGDILDIIEIDAASNNGVDEIRDLRDKIKYTPAVANYKVYIIDEVHMLTKEAFNALLKTLEEPPKYVIFILATTEVHKIPPTIISRCQRFDFKNIEVDDIYQNLKRISEIEKLTITDEALKAIAINSEGGMRDAISLLDQVISFTDDVITDEDIYKVSGGLSRSFINELLLAVYNRQTQKVLEIINQVLQEGKDINRVVADLILSLRDLLLDKINPNPIYPSLSEISNSKIYAYLNILNQLQQDIRWTNQKRAYLELGLIKMINHESIYKVDLEDKVSNLEHIVLKLENKLKNQKPVIVEQNNVVKKANENKVPLVTILEVQEIMNNGKRDLKNKLKANWANLKDYDEPSLKLQAELLSQGSLEAISDSKMLLVYDDKLTAETMLRPETKQKVKQILNKNSKLIDDYVVVIKSDWVLIKEEYMAMYNAGHKKPTLSPRDLHLYRLETPKQETKKDEPIVDLAIEYFGKENVKVEE